MFFSVMFRFSDVLSEEYSNLFSLTSATGPNVELQTVKPDAIPSDPLEIDILVKVSLHFIY